MKPRSMKILEHNSGSRRKVHWGRIMRVGRIEDLPAAKNGSHQAGREKPGPQTPVSQDQATEIVSRQFSITFSPH